MLRDGQKTLATEARHSVYIKRKVSEEDGEGGFRDVWIRISSVFCAIFPIQARQQFLNKSVGVDTTHLIKMRGKIDIRETDEIEYGTRIFEVLTVENIQERDFEQIVTCKERRP